MKIRMLLHSVEIAEVKCKMIDAKAKGDKAAVVKYQKEIEKTYPHYTGCEKFDSLYHFE